MSEIKRIYKVGEGRIVDGVCAGVARYLGVEPLWVRIAWVALGLLGGMGVVGYVLAMVIFPRSEEAASPLADVGSRGVVGAVVLVCFGLFLLTMGGVGRYDFWEPWRIAWQIFLPLSVIGGGGVILLAHFEQSYRTKVLSRSSTDRRFLGICGGLGRYFEKDPNLIRFIFASVTVLSRGVGLLVYVIMAILFSEGSESKNSAG